RMSARLSRSFPSTAIESTLTGPGPGSCPAAGEARITQAGTARKVAARAATFQNLRPITSVPIPSRLRRRAGPEREALPVARDPHLDLVSGAELRDEDLLGERVLEVALDRPLE